MPSVPLLATDGGAARTCPAIYRNRLITRRRRSWRYRAAIPISRCPPFIAHRKPTRVAILTASKQSPRRPEVQADCAEALQGVCSSQLTPCRSEASPVDMRSLSPASGTGALIGVSHPNPDSRRCKITNTSLQAAASSPTTPVCDGPSPQCAFGRVRVANWALQSSAMSVSASSVLVGSDPRPIGRCEDGGD